ncbi:MAG: flagella basal body P-ring formation protein FlgA [Fimbriimonas ginsengisoli]|uniref:Flagella basal body P-ring formation protein FlgA n=1 Tax=Fimbriimonas ginsengisoli TaxID=1005039 RepID=A0A931PTR5_FIMGI|nr:flagella basal body P-ring formation protein FlgA [Fimbriimonas ginsengisoli]
MFSALIAGVALTQGLGIDLWVDGKGMLRFAREGRAVYAKRARLVAQGGELVGPGGCPLLPSIRVASTGQSLSVDLEGRLTVVTGSSRTEIGRLVLAVVPDESRLAADGAFLISAERPTLGEPGEGVLGVIRSTEGAAVHAQATITKPTLVAPYVGPVRAAVTGPGTIKVRPVSQIAGSRMLLGELADISGPADLVERLSKAEVGDSPTFGVSRGIDSVSIESWLSRAGFATKDIRLEVPPGARAERAAQRIPESRFTDAAIEAARSRIGIAAPLSSDSQQGEFVCPAGAVALEVEALNQSGTSITATVAVRVDGKRYNARALSLHIDGGAVAIRPGQSVKVVIRSAGAVVEISGKARTGGVLGQSVTVVTASGTTHTGRVTGPDQVEVKL